MATPRNFGKKRNASTTPPPKPTPEQEEKERNERAAKEKANVKTEIRQQLAEKLTELSLDEHLFKGWMRDVIREEFAGFLSDNPAATENWLLAVGGDKREKPAATKTELESVVGKDDLSKLKTMTYELGRQV